MLKNSVKIYSLLIKQTKSAISPCLASSQVRLQSNQPNANEQWEKIYDGPLTRQIRGVKFFSISSSVLGVAVQPILYKEIVALESVPLAVAAYSFVGFFTLVTPILLHLVTKKYVTSIDYDSTNDVYLARTYNFIGLPKELRFKVEDVQVPTVPGLFTSVVAKGNPLFMDANQFTDTRHYAKMMGFDKPIDFKLYQNPVTEGKEK